jgi:DUF1680 family protein
VDRLNPTNEAGGWSEALQDLHDLTGLHCNTHIPMTIGAARRYERSGDARYHAAAIFFWERTALGRSYVNGGSSGPRPDGLEKSKRGRALAGISCARPHVDAEN